MATETLVIQYALAHTNDIRDMDDYGEQLTSDNKRLQVCWKIFAAKLILRVYHRCRHQRFGCIWIWLRLVSQNYNLCVLCCFNFVCKNGDRKSIKSQLHLEWRVACIFCRAQRKVPNVRADAIHNCSIVRVFEHGSTIVCDGVPTAHSWRLSIANTAYTVSLASVYFVGKWMSVWMRL